MPHRIPVSTTGFTQAVTSGGRDGSRETEGGCGLGKVGIRWAIVVLHGRYRGWFGLSRASPWMVAARNISSPFVGAHPVRDSFAPRSARLVFARARVAFGCRATANMPLTTEGSPCGTQRAFRRPAGDAKLVPCGDAKLVPWGDARLVPWDRRVTFLLLAHAHALCVRTAKPVRTRSCACVSKQRKVTRPSAEGRKPAAGEPSRDHQHARRQAPF